MIIKGVGNDTFGSAGRIFGLVLLRSEAEPPYSPNIINTEQPINANTVRNNVGEPKNDRNHRGSHGYPRNHIDHQRQHNRGNRQIRNLSGHAGFLGQFLMGVLPGHQAQVGRHLGGFPERQHRSDKLIPAHQPMSRTQTFSHFISEGMHID